MKIEGEAIQVLYALRKKSLLYYQPPDISKLLHSRALDYLQSTGRYGWTLKCKGIPLKAITHKTMLGVVENQKSVCVDLPVSMKKDHLLGIIKHQQTRSIGYGNFARLPPDEFGRLLPYPTYKHFLNRLEEAQFTPQELEMLQAEQAASLVGVDFEDAMEL